MSALALPAAVRALPVTVCRVVGSHDPPFRDFDTHPPGGLYFELLREAARRAGWPLQFIQAPAARALLMVEQGQADLMAGPLRSADRERFLHYSRIQLPPEDKVVLTAPGAAPVRRLEDLFGRRLAVHRGKRYGELIDEEPRLRRIELVDYRSALRMLAVGRVDAVLLPERTALQLQAELRLSLAQQPFRIAGDTPYLVLGRHSPWLARLSELEEAVLAMQRSGQWARISANYPAGPSIQFPPRTRRTP